MDRTVTITLPYEVAHRLEIQCAIDNVRLAEGIERLLTFLVDEFGKARGRK